MATAEWTVVRSEGDDPSRSNNDSSGRPMNRIREIREQQGMTLRTCARRMRLDMRSLRAQEEPTADLRLSQLRLWQEALEVPLVDLIEETNAPLSRPVMERARMIRLMKTAQAIVEQADSLAVKRFATMLVEQLVEVMPELAEVTGWHSVGQRRTLDEMGQTAMRPIPTSSILSNLLAMQDD